MSHLLRSALNNWIHHGVFAGAAPAGSPLLDSLISYWALDEESGTRFDSHGSNDLTDNNTVGFGTGKQGNAADFELANSESLSIADNASLSMGDVDFTFTAWVQMESQTTSMYVISKDTGISNLEYGFFYRSTTDKFRWYVSGDGSTVSFIECDTFGTLALATWFFVVIYHDATNNEIGISVNNGPFDTAAHTTGVRDGANTFRLGAAADGTVPFDGLIDEVGLWKRLLTAQEISDLFNGGAGLAYPF